tara:strand:+ start:845 stop:1081 length:237 start_codon:yes stop_codon:yes gene_type:complete
MTYKEFVRFIEYNIPCIEFYNEDGDLEYRVDITEYDFYDIDVILSPDYEPYGIVKLQRYDKKKPDLNGKGLQPPKSKL